MNNLLYKALPLSLLILPYVFYATLDGAAFYFNKESGLLENITVLLLGIALIVSVRLLIAQSSKNQGALQKQSTLWLILYCAGCIYFMGEEISWGQHLFDWSTPETWLQVNDQQETNLHNTYPIFDQIPRALMTLGIIVGGFIYPLVISRKNTSTERSTTEQSEKSGIAPLLDRFMPGKQCITSAGTVLFVSVHDKLYDLFGTSVPEILDINDGEVKESLIALFILVYICDLKQRWRQANK